MTAARPGPSHVLKIDLGLTETASAVGDGTTAAQLVMTESASVAPTGGFWVRRAKATDRYRLEIVGAPRSDRR